MKACLYTLGCKVNAIETGSIAALLREEGFTVSEDPSGADVIVLNSCTVTASGDSRMRRQLRTLRREHPDAVIVLTGCYVQAFPEEAAAIPEADILTGTRHRSAIPGLIREYLAHPHRILAQEAYMPGDAFEPLPQGTDAAHTRAFLKIQDGCDRFCTYCIIPYARGRSRSRSASDIRKEAAALAAQGFREIVLCGINLACWEDQGMDLADAAGLCADAGFPRIRLGSLEPDGLTEDVLDRLAAVPGLCPQFHISVQSGCDRTLAAMHRHYTTEEYAALLTRIRARFPEAAVTTDLMVGFPGETDSDFAETLCFAEAMHFARIHVFRYSPRPGTPAAAAPEQIPEAVKKSRADQLAALGARMQAEFLAGMAGRKVSVLFERERGDGWHRGHAENYAAVQVPSDGADWRGTIRTVTVTSAESGHLLAAP